MVSRIPELSATPLLSLAAGQDFVLPSTIVNFPSNQTQTTITITINSRVAYTGNLQFSLRIRSSGSGALEFTNSVATVTIVDEQGEIITYECDDPLPKQLYITYLYRCSYANLSHPPAVLFQLAIGGLDTLTCQQWIVSALRCTCVYATCTCI